MIKALDIIALLALTQGLFSVILAAKTANTKTLRILSALSFIGISWALWHFIKIVLV